MTGVDTDLATLRRFIDGAWHTVDEQGNRTHSPRYLATVATVAALARVEAELARLREQLDMLHKEAERNFGWAKAEREKNERLSRANEESDRTWSRVLGRAEASEARAEAAEARCARLQQALRELERMAGAAGSGETPAMPLARIAREALAGPDTPADEVYGERMAGIRDTPADSFVQGANVGPMQNGVNQAGDPAVRRPADSQEPA